MDVTLFNSNCWCYLDARIYGNRRQSVENEYGPDPKQVGVQDNTQRTNQELKLS